MKDYDRYVFWLDYFNSELKRRDGRRVPLSSATRAPTLDELGEACRRLNLQPAQQPALRPSSPSRASGYVSVVKQKPKHSLLLRIAKERTAVRPAGVRKQAQGGRPKKK
jgi:signal recognition particle subunit SEC65